VQLEKTEMTNVVPIRALSETLVDQFIALAIEHGIMIANDDTRRANRLFDKMALIEKELTARGDRRMLLPLFEHADPWVRLISATKVFAEAPTAARQVLEDLKVSKTPLACFYAASTLRHLDEGIWVPK
jgi:hypothetical protein